MSTPVTTFFYSTSNTVSTPQINEGPLTINPMSKLLGVTVKGQINVQSSVISSPVTGNNNLMWAVYWVPTGSAIPNIVGGSDGRNFLARGQLGNADLFLAWAPNTSSAVTFGGFGTEFSWRGQQETGGGIDIYVSFRSPFAAGIGTVITNGTIRAWAV